MTSEGSNVHNVPAWPSMLQSCCLARTALIVVLGSKTSSNCYCCCNHQVAQVWQVQMHPAMQGLRNLPACRPCHRSPTTGNRCDHHERQPLGGLGPYVCTPTVHQEQHQLPCRALATTPGHTTRGGTQALACAWARHCMTLGACCTLHWWQATCSLRCCRSLTLLSHHVQCMHMHLQASDSLGLLTVGSHLCCNMCCYR